MKNTPLFFTSFFCIVALYMASNFVFAQSTTALPKAYITNELYVLLDGDAPQNTKVFEADILELHLATEEQVNRFFGFFNDPSIQFVTNLATQKVTVTLIPNAEKQNWTLQQWANYLKDKVSAQRQQFGEYIDFTTK